MTVRPAAPLVWLALLWAGPAVGQGSPDPGRLHVGASLFTNVLSPRAPGLELGASYGVIPQLDVGAGVTLGGTPGAELTIALHPRRSTERWKVAPFAQLRALYEPLPNGAATGGGLWGGASIELGPGRMLLGASAEVYRLPANYRPVVVLALAGYELDLLRPGEAVRTVEVERIVEVPKVVETERVVEVTVPPPPPTEGVFRGQVLDLDDRPLTASLRIAGASGEPGAREHLAAPGFELRLAPGTYQVEAHAEGHLARGRSVAIVAGQTLVYDFVLRPIPKVKSAELTAERVELRQMIQFATNEALILSSSYFILDEVVDILLQHPDRRVRIEGHTDDVGGAEFNLALSNRRAEAVKAFLVERGIASERLQTQGFGLTRPVSKNQSEAGRARNRRVQFEILKAEATP